jgi:septation ring formation regulator EzrA
MQSDYKGAAEQATKQHATKIEQWRVRFAKLREDVSNEKEKWMSKYSKLEEQLQSTRDRVYLERVKHRTLIQKQIEETERVEMMRKTHRRA